MKRSLGTTPCVVKDSSCHIMQGGDFGETINGGRDIEKEFVMRFKNIHI